MATTENIILKVSADTGEFTQAVEKATDKVKELKDESTNTGESGKFAFGLLDQATGGLAGKVKQSVTAVKGLNIGLKGTKAAIAATGIGLLIVAVGELIANFDKISDFFRDKTRENALQRENALLAWAGESQKESLEIAKIQKQSANDIFKIRQSLLEIEEDQLTNEIAIKKEQGDQEAVLQLQKNLRQKQLDIVLLQATAEQDLQDILEQSKRLNDAGYAASKAREEAVKSEQEQLNALSERSKKFTDEIAATRKQLAYQTKEYEKASEGEYKLGVAKLIAEKEILIAQAEANLTEVLSQEETLRAAIQTKLAGHDAALSQSKDAVHQGNLERIAEEKAAELALRAELLQDDLDSLQEEQDYMDASADIMMESFSAEQSIEAQKREEFLKTNQLFTELIENQTETERAAAEASQQLIDSQAAARAAAFKGAIDMGIQVLGAFQALNEAFSGDSEKQQKKAFQRNKAIGISTAIINTAGAIIGAINPASGGLGIPAGLPGAAIAAATGVAQIATIAKSRFKSGGGTSPSAPSGGGAAGPPIPTAPQLDLSFLGGGAGQTGFRTYVIASEVSNSQQANQKINDQAALVG